MTQFYSNVISDFQGSGLDVAVDLGAYLAVDVGVCLDTGVNEHQLISRIDVFLGETPF